MALTPTLKSIEDLFGKLQREAHRAWRADEEIGVEQAAAWARAQLAAAREARPQEREQEQERAQEHERQRSRGCGRDEDFDLER